MISVLLPTYNQAKFLPACLASLTAQTRKDFKVIAVNDGSTDETREILKANGLDFVDSVTNEGTAAAINLAALLMPEDTQFVTWVSSDNIMHPDWLAKLVAALKSDRQIGAVYSGYRSCPHGIAKDTKASKPKDIRPMTYQPDALLKSDNCYFGPSFLVRREVWQDHQGGTAHDYDAWARIEDTCLASGLTLKSIPDVLVDYHHGDWNTVQMRPDLYDAPKWRAEAIDRRRNAPRV